MDREALERLTKEDLIALVLAQQTQIEARLRQPPKTPDNSSTPPSTGEKAKRSEKAKKPRRGRPGRRGPAACRGYDAGKKIKGVTYHILVDTLGRMLNVVEASSRWLDGVAPARRRRYPEGMTVLPQNWYDIHRFPLKVIRHAIWLYFRFPLSLRMVEEMLAPRGIVVSHETIRQ